MRSVELIPIRELAIVWSLVLPIVAPARADSVETPRETKAFATSPPWGRICSIDSTLILQLEADLKDVAVVIPRLNNPVKAVYFRGRPDQTLQLIPHPDEWVIDIPPALRADASDAIVVQLEGEPYLPTEPRVLRADENGEILLPAHDAVTHGKSLRYEPQPNKNTLGYWTDQNDWASWHFSHSRPGRYVVSIRYGCGNGQGGSLVRLTCGSEALQWQVEATGGFQEWRDLQIGEIELKAGEQELTLRAVRLQKTAVMDVQQVKLIPIR